MLQLFKQQVFDISYVINILLVYNDNVFYLIFTLYGRLLALPYIECLSVILCVCVCVCVFMTGAVGVPLPGVEVRIVLDNGSSIIVVAEGNHRNCQVMTSVHLFRQ